MSDSIQKNAASKKFVIHLILICIHIEMLSHELNLACKKWSVLTFFYFTSNECNILIREELKRLLIWNLFS